LENLESRELPSTVTNLNDAGPGSLRQAILDTPAGGMVDFQPGLSGTITLTTGELAISKDLTIAGPGASVITVSGNHASRVFDLNAPFTVDISGLTIADGLGNIVGGGILNRGALAIDSSTIRDNDVLADVGSGCGIANYGMLTVTHSTVRDNVGVCLGGGIANDGTLAVISSTLSGNSASSGGGIFNSGTLTVTSSTLSDNSATGADGNGGGIVNNDGRATITDSTLNGSSAGSTGGGIFNPGEGTLSVTGCTIAGNSAANGGGLYSPIGLFTRDTIIAGDSGGSGPDVLGDLGSQGHNLIGDTSGGIGFVPSDLLNVDPQLGPLQDNGGPTQTRALLPGSPALNAGDPAELGTADQRGVVRRGGVNIGAYQASTTAFLITAPPKATAGVPFDVTVTAVDPFGQVAVGYTGTVTFGTTDPDPGVVLPADYAFTRDDGGVHTFAGETTLLTHGYQALAVTDTTDGSVQGSATVKVKRNNAGEMLSAGLSPGPGAAGDRVLASGAPEALDLLWPGQE
jgi:hypothetical protein